MLPKLNYQYIQTQMDASDYQREQQQQQLINYSRFQFNDPKIRPDLPSAIKFKQNQLIRKSANIKLRPTEENTLET